MQSTTNRRAGGLNFSAKSGERQKHLGALIGALATGCKAPGLFGKKTNQPLRGNLFLNILATTCKSTLLKFSVRSLSPCRPLNDKGKNLILSVISASLR
jgi:hypothetical protein